MTTTTGDTRIGLVRARFEDIPDLDLSTAGYLLTGLHDLLAVQWMLEFPQGRVDLEGAPSPVMRSISLNSPMEVLLWASGGMAVAHQAVRLYVRVQVARTIKTKADIVVEAGRLMREELTHEMAMDPKVIGAIERASRTLAVIGDLAVVDETDDK